MPRLMEVLEFQDDSGEMMVKRIPDAGECEVKWGAQLTVRENQRVVFLRDGKSAMTFEPGRHILKTANFPILTKLVTMWGYGPDSPFRAEVYFLNMKLFSNLKWGTKEPVPFRDPELQLINLRAFGVFSLKIADPGLFLEHFTGMMGSFTHRNLEDWFRNIASVRFTDFLGGTKLSVFDLPAQYEEVSAAVREKLLGDFTACGLELVDFFVQSISVPDEVQAAINERSKMAAVGDMNTYTRYKAARALEAAATQEGGVAGAGVGMGAGLGLGMMLPQMLGNAQAAAGGAGGGTAAGEDPIAKISRLKELLDAGALTEAEFNAKKAELLSQVK